MKTIKELAQMCGCSKTTINRFIRQLNITTMQDKNRLLVSDEDTKKLQQHIANIAPNVTQTAPDEIKIAPKIETSIPENATQQVETAPNKTKTATKIETNAPENATQQAKNAPNRNKIAPNCTKTQHIETENATFKTNRNITPNTDIISIYCETIEILKEQLKQKDQQIQNLQEENKLLIQSNAFALKQLEEKNEAEAIQKQEQEPDIKVYVEKSKSVLPQEVVKKKKKFILSWFNKL